MCVYTPLREPITRRTVAAVTSELGAHDRLLLVVDHAPAYADRLRVTWPHLTVLENTGTRGLSGARNTGVAFSEADVVVFVDDDAVPRPGWADALRSAFADRECTIVGGAVHARWRARPGAPEWFPPEYGWVVGCDYRGMPAPGRPIRNPIGAAMAIRRTAFDVVGGFDETLGRRGRLPAGCEETEFAIRLATAEPGGRMFREPGFAVDHEVPADRATLRYFLRRCFWEGRSKAAMTRVVSPSAGLSAEAHHAVSVLPRAWLRDVGDAVRGRPLGILRAGVSIAGLGAAAVGFGSARLTARRPAAPSVAADAEPRPESGPAPRITSVLCTIGRSPYLDECLRALLNQSHDDFEVVVVDNDPARGTAASIVDRYTDPRIRVVTEPRRGLSWARNRGSTEARGQIIAFTDDDAVPDANWLTALEAVFAADTDRTVACVTGRVPPVSVHTDAERWFETGIGFDKGPVARFWSEAEPWTRPGGLSPDIEPGPQGPLFPISAGEFGSGNNMAFRKDWLLRHRGFDVRLGAGSPTRGGEDLDAFRRVVLSGATLVYTPTALVHHHHRTTLPDLRRQAFGYGSGMAASLIGYALSGPGQTARVLRVLPHGVRTLLGSRSPKNRARPLDYPRSVVVAELAGYLCGPALFGAAVVAERRSRPRAERSARGHRG